MTAKDVEAMKLVGKRVTFRDKRTGVCYRATIKDYEFITRVYVWLAESPRERRIQLSPKELASVE